MKRNLGRLLFFCLHFFMLQAEDFSYAFHVDNTQPYVKEAVVLTVDLNQTNTDIVLLFDFNIVENENYSFQRLDAKQTDTYHNAKVHYAYILYPLKAGDINITFALTKKVTTDDSLAYSFSGDRDNVKKLETKNTKITLPPLALEVKALPADTQLVGDFTLEYVLKTHKAKAYETLPMQVILKGKGYPPLLDGLLPKDINYTVFTEKPLIDTVTDAQGSHSTVTYSMAFSHSKNFTLPTILLKSFNPKTDAAYVLSVPTQTFEISEVNKTRLVDTVDVPPALSVADWSWLKTLLSYLVVFAAGYLSAFTFKLTKKSAQRQIHPLIEKIQNAKDAKSLLQILMAHNSHDFNSSIKKLENALYSDGKITLTEIKQESIKNLKGENQNEQ